MGLCQGQVFVTARKTHQKTEDDPALVDQTVRGDMGEWIEELHRARHG